MSGEGLIAEPRAVHPTEGHARLQELMHRGTAFLGCDVAIMGGAMSWVSERNLVSAISNAGIAAKMFETLAERGINILAISTSEIKVSVLLPEEYTELAVRVLHTAFGLDAAEQAG